MALGIGKDLRGKHDAMMGAAAALPIAGGFSLSRAAPRAT